MKIALGADHRGLEFKNKIKSHLLDTGIEVTDFGAFSEESTE